MSLVIRNIKESDYKAVEVLTREAFWNVYRPGCSEHLVLNNIHKQQKSIKELELVAEYNNKIVGHIVYTKGHLDKVNDNDFITFGPLSVMPDYQNKGIASLLVRISLQKAARLGYYAVFITGDDKYYSRFGFEPASKYGIHMEGVPIEDEAPFFMVKCLKNNILTNINGYYMFDECFNVNEEELEEFDKNFEEKKKEVREGQLM